MTQKKILPSITVGVCVTLILVGCIKSNEYLLRLDDIGRSCKLKTFYYKDFQAPNFDSVAFHYNSLGDPDSATWTQLTPHTNFYFRYDSHHRLLDFIAAYPGGLNATFWYRFFYTDEHTNNPYVDTLYVYPDQTTHWPPITHNYFAPRFYTFDSLGRIIRRDIDYVYDAHGDLVLAGAQFNGPDDKVNYNRTSRIFQLLDADYAVNNVVIADSYNSYGLPTSITAPFYGEGVEPFLGIAYANAKFDYDCSSSHHK